MLGLRKAVGEGADCDTRGCVCSPGRKLISTAKDTKSTKGKKAR
jgi:hypothetical protein